MIKSVTRAYESRTRSTIHDLHQPRGTPAIQLSPSPELEPLPTFSSVLADGVPDPDSMDWEPTEPAVRNTASRSDSRRDGASGASAWDRFATAKQRIFARERLTGLERAFESWKDLGMNVNTQPIPTLRQPNALSSHNSHSPTTNTLRPMLLMLASVFRILSLAVALRRENFAWLRITAATMEVGCAAPLLIQQRRWTIQVSLSVPFPCLLAMSHHWAARVQTVIPIIQAFSAFLYLVAQLPVAQIVLTGLGKPLYGTQICIVDGCMAIIDLVACCL
jgi:hypothetical protein